jgi:hypothetical protein
MTKPGDSQTKKTIRELAKEFPDKTYNELEKYKDADRIEEADSIPLTPAQKNLVEHIEAGIKSYDDRDKILEWEDLSNRGDSFHEFPTYIKHWETAKPWGWELRVLTEDGLHIFHLKWKTYKRSGLLKEEKDVQTST